MVVSSSEFHTKLNIASSKELEINPSVTGDTTWSLYAEEATVLTVCPPGDVQVLV